MVVPYNHTLEPKILSIAVTKAKLCDLKDRDKFSITGIGNFRYFLAEIWTIILKN